MKFYCRVILPFGIQEPFALGKINQVAIFIFHDIILLKACEILDCFFIAGYPAGFVKGERHEGAGRAILLQQPVLYDLKLQVAHAADYLAVAAMLGK